MTGVYLLSTAPHYDPENSRTYKTFEQIKASASADNHGNHRLVDHPADAELIIFVHSSSPDLRDIKRHPLFQTYRNKCFVFHIDDRIIPFIPGVFTCLEKRFHTKSRTRSGCYPRVFENELLSHDTHCENARLLFSFVGRTETHPVRKKLYQLQHARALVYDHQTKILSKNAANTAEIKLDGTQTSYYETLVQSKFVLCPRGYGSSSLRVFETMKVGRVPVIISDQWVEPFGPNWSGCSVRISEANISKAPTLLESLEPNASTMAACARAEWVSWFSLNSAFNFIVESCLEILDSRGRAYRMLELLPNLYRLHPSHSLWGLKRRFKLS